MILSFHPCFDTDVQIILGARRLNSDDHRVIRKAEAIILPQWCHEDLYRACSGSGAPMFPNYEMRFRYPGKTGQSHLFRDFRFQHPATLRWKGVEEFKNAYPGVKAFPHDLPFLFKDDKSHEAEGVYLVEDRHTLLKALEHLEQKERSGQKGFVTQEFVPSQGNVLRTVIIGNHFVTYWKRPQKPAQVITTISRDAVIDHHWRPELQEKGEKETLALSGKTGINLAAVDFVFSLDEENPEPFFLEINYFFGRRGLGGSEKYYGLLYEAVLDWLNVLLLDPGSVKLV